MVSLTPRNSLRFSLTSCVTEDSADSASVATPLDLSPAPQPTAHFPVITVNEELSPYRTRFHIPDVAAVVARPHRRRQGPFSPIPRSIQIVHAQDPSHYILSQLPVTSSANLRIQRQQQTQAHRDDDSITRIQQEEQRRPVWPRIKRILSSSSLPLSSSAVDSSLDINMRKKHSTSSRGMMTHLSSLVHSSMRLVTTMTNTDSHRRQQHQSSVDVPVVDPANIVAEKKESTVASTPNRGWFGRKGKSRVTPHQRRAMS